MGSTGTEELLQQAVAGDSSAVSGLLARHRGRLKQMVAVRMDRRLARRVDPSDIVQEALIDASRKLPVYLEERPLPFYVWLRQITLEKLIQQNRYHQAAGRSVKKEQTHDLQLPEHSATELAAKLLRTGTSPSRSLLREETRIATQQLLAELRPPDREILVLRFLEQLSTAEAAGVLDLTESGVKSRLRRALQRFAQLAMDHSMGFER